MKSLGFEVILECESDAEGYWMAYCPSLPGCYSTGRTAEEAKKHIAQAVALHLETLVSIGQVVPEGAGIPGTVRVEKIRFFAPKGREP